MEAVSICVAAPEDLPAILALQKLAYQSEAELLGNPDIPPLRQTLAQVEQEYKAGILLKLLYRGELVGSVRGRSENGTLYVGKLVVHPKHRKKGYGTMLLDALEARCPGLQCELFTSAQSAANLRLYERRGYRRFKEEAAGGVTMVYLEKTIP